MLDFLNPSLPLLSTLYNMAKMASEFCSCPPPLSSTDLCHICLPPFPSLSAQANPSPVRETQSLLQPSPNVASPTQGLARLAKLRHGDHEQQWCFPLSRPRLYSAFIGKNSPTRTHAHSKTRAESSMLQRCSCS